MDFIRSFKYSTSLITVLETSFTENYSHLSDSVASINPEIRSSHVRRSIRQEEGHRSHQVLRLAHSSLGNERRPCLFKIRIIIQDLLRSDAC